MKKLLIGGAALMQLGSTRHSYDVDYLTFVENEDKPFIHMKDEKGTEIDLINANGHAFFAQVWAMEKDNNSNIASVQAIFELKCFAFSQHCVNRHFQKMDNAEFDLKFLVRTFGKLTMKLAHKHMPLSHKNEIESILKKVEAEKKEKN